MEAKIVYDLITALRANQHSSQITKKTKCTSDLCTSIYANLRQMQRFIHSLHTPEEIPILYH